MPATEHSVMTANILGSATRTESYRLEIGYGDDGEILYERELTDG